MKKHEIADPLIAALTADERDQLFPLLGDGPAVVAQLTGGRRPHRSALHRWARKGVAGAQLQTVTVGRARYTTRRLLLEFFAAVDAARRGAKTPQPDLPHPTSHPTQSATTTAEDEDVLFRHGLDGRSDN